MHIDHRYSLPAASKANVEVTARVPEREWLAQHRSEYQGMWFALEGSVLAAHGALPREVLNSRTFSTATGQFKAHGHEVTIEVLGFETTSKVYFFADETIVRNVL